MNQIQFSKEKISCYQRVNGEHSILNVNKGVLKLVNTAIYGMQ